jgi:cell division protease FtsH
MLHSLKINFMKKNKKIKNITKNFGKNIVAFILSLFLVVVLFGIIATETFKEVKNISINELATEINKESVEKLIVVGSNIEVIFKDKETAFVKKEPDVAPFESLKNWGAEEDKIRKISIDFKDEQDWSFLVTLLIISLPLLFLLFIFRSIFKQAKGGAMQALDFSKAKARVFGTDGSPKSGVTFDDVAGLEEAKEELKEVVDFLKEPARFLKLGARIPKGTLLTGAPGTGKTLLARAVAGEANVPFFEISGSEFIELFVGVGSGRVRDLFANAKKKQPCIIYIDELDAIGRARGAGLGGGHDEREQTLNQILSEMDGFKQDAKIVVLASTNRPDVLDSALLRPGRFDRKIILDLPDKKARESVLIIHSKGKPLAKDIDLKEVAERTPGFSGADLSNLANEAALLAVRRERKVVEQIDFLESIEKVLLGPERKSYAMGKKEKELAAYHEAGHAIVSSFLPNAEPVRKISIVARGQAGGYTIKIPSEERRIKRKSEFISEIAVLLGGYTTEKIIFGEVSTGAVNDLERASNYARKLVKEFGMSSLGPIHFRGEREHVFLGREFAEEKNYSEETAAKIDKEIFLFIEEGRKKAEEVVLKNKDVLEKVAKTLIEKETLEREDYEKIIGKKQEKEISDKK